MKKLILGATGSIGSSLAKKVVEDGGEVHLVGREKSSLAKLASELNSSFTTCDVLEENFADKIFNDLGNTPINGLAYCVGSSTRIPSTWRSEIFFHHLILDIHR